MSDPETTGEKRKPIPPVEHQFKAGNPGRPKGSRNKLGEAFLADMLADWEANGAATITSVRTDKPDVYLKVVASILPQQLNVKVSEVDDLTDEQLDRQLRSIVAQLAAAGLDLVSGAGSAEASQPAPGVPTVQ